MHTGENTHYSSWHESGPHLGRSKSLPWLLSRRVEGNVDLSVVRILVRDRTTNHCWYHTSPVSNARRGRQGNETGNGCLLSSSLGLMLNYLGTYHHQCVFACMKKPNAACLLNQCPHCLSSALHKLIQITRNDFRARLWPSRSLNVDATVPWTLFSTATRQQWVLQLIYTSSSSNQSQYLWHSLRLFSCWESFRIIAAFKQGESQFALISWMLWPTINSTWCGKFIFDLNVVTSFFFFT